LLTLNRETGYFLGNYRSQPGSRLDVVIGKAMAFVNDWDDVGLTQVHIAATKGDMLLALREQPWAIDQFNENGQAPIHLAVSSCNFEGLEQLIQAGLTSINEMLAILLL
jgi:ankyrin repeat protein